MNISVVVSVYSLDRFDDLIELLDGIGQQTYRDFEAIIVIDENRDLLQKVEDYAQNNKQCSIKAIYNPENNGLSYSRNIGIKNSIGNILAFIDDDAIPDINWAKSIFETFNEDNDIGAVTGDVIPLWEFDEMLWFPKELHWMISCSYVMTPTVKQEVERGFGTNMAFRRDVIDKVGPFDINFGINGKKWIGGEDTDMFLRVKKAGMKIVFNPEIMVQHKIYRYRIKTRNIIKRAFDGGYSVALMKKSFTYDLPKSTEDMYLRHLLFDFYPTALKNILYNPLSHMKRIGIVTTVIFFEFIGYFYGFLA